MSARPRRTLIGRCRRFFHRRTGWILLLALLAAAGIYHSGAARAPGKKLEIAYSILPPVAMRPVHVKYDDVPLQDILGDLSRQSGARFSVTENLKTGFREDLMTPVTIDARTSGAVPLWMAIALIFDQWPGRFYGVDFASDPVLLGFAEDMTAPARQTTATYPVDDLLQLKSPWVYADFPSERLKQLAGLIRRVVSNPAGWAEGNGKGGAITIRGNTLVVTTTPMIHYQVKQLLDALRRFRQ